jgi:phosphatidylserine/phosphatidylglycerophosphate/cardiolipin synthase-like enzyme
VDDEWFSVGSANLNRRGISADTEMNVHSIAPEAARALRVRLWAEHLGLPEAEIADTDPIALIDREWESAGHAMEERLRKSTMPAASTVCRYVPARNPVSRLLDVIQDVTLEH